ncbi:hypothetical protein NHX12_028286, partial [Muraenolepis orangiensis]
TWLGCLAVPWCVARGGAGGRGGERSWYSLCLLETHRAVPASGRAGVCLSVAQRPCPGVT